MAGARDIRAGRANVEIGVTDRFSRGLRKAQERLSAFGVGVAKIGAGFTAIGAAAIAPLALATKIFTESGDQLDKMSKRTGIAVETLSELDFAAQQSGTSLVSLEKSVKFMQRAITEAQRGTLSAVYAFDELGLSADKLSKASPEEQFYAVADALSRVEDPTKRAALALKVFEEQGTNILPLIKDGAAGLDEYRKRARELGLTMGTETAAAAAKLKDTLNVMNLVVKSTAKSVGSALAPALTKVLDLVIPIVVDMNRLIKANKGIVVAVAATAAGVLALGGTLIFLGTSAIVLGFALGGLASAVGVAVTAFGALASVAAAVATPIGLAILGVVGLGLAIVKWSGLGDRAITYLGERFGQLGRFVGSVATGIVNALAAGDLQLAAEVLWAGLRVVWETGANELNGIWLMVRNFFITNAQRMWYGAQAAFEIFADALGINWVDLVAFLSTTLTNFGSSFRSFWESLTGFVAKRIVDLQGAFDESIDTDALKAEIDVQTRQRRADIEADRQASILEIQERREARAGETLDDSLARIGNEFAAAQRALEDATGASVGAAQKRLDDARANLDKALKDAQAARDAAPDGGAFGRGLRDFAADLESAIGGVRERVAVEGTFSAFAAQGLQLGGDADVRTAKATEKIEQVVKNIEVMTRGLNLAFGG